MSTQIIYLPDIDELGYGLVKIEHSLGTYVIFPTSEIQTVVDELMRLKQRVDFLKSQNHSDDSTHFFSELPQ